MGRWFGVLQNPYSGADTPLITFLILVALYGVGLNCRCVSS